MFQSMEVGRIGQTGRHVQYLVVMEHVFEADHVTTQDLSLVEQSALEKIQTLKHVTKGIVQVLLNLQVCQYMNCYHWLK